jgi:Indolepyruvate ferredoxin oxidoreductase, alpha and beta subunits
MEALRLLGVDEAACHRLGIEIYKVGMVWPLARHAALDFVSGKDEVVVVEESAASSKASSRNISITGQGLRRNLWSASMMARASG